MLRVVVSPIVVSPEAFDTSVDLTNSSIDSDSFTGSSQCANEKDGDTESSAPGSVVTSVTPTIILRRAAANIEPTYLIPLGNVPGRTRAGRKVQLTRRALGVELCLLHKMGGRSNFMCTF